MILNRPPLGLRDWCQTEGGASYSGAAGNSLRASTSQQPTDMSQASPQQQRLNAHQHMHLGITQHTHMAINTCPNYRMTDASTSIPTCSSAGMPGSTYTLRQRSSGKGDRAPPSSRYSIR